MNFFSDTQAIEIWKSRWLGFGVQSLVEQYKKSPFRFYEVWSEEKNVGTRAVAWEQFKSEFPEQAKHVDPTPHVAKRKVIPLLRNPDGQIDMFN